MSSAAPGRSPLRPFVWSAALWLPACFTLWALSSSLLVWMVVQVLNLLLPALLPYAVSAVEQHAVVFEVVTTISRPAVWAAKASRSANWLMFGS